MHVTAVLVTFNRKDLLLECLQALARQTRRVDRVVVVDNASTDGTPEALEASGLGERLPLELLRLTRNGGGSEGFHFGVREALRPADGPDWVWLMDDDCEPADDALERLLATPGAADPSVGAVVPAVRDEEGRLLPMHRGRITARWVRAPIVAAAETEYERPEAELDFCSFVGPLYRASAVRAMGLPLREAFIRFEDLEYAARLRPHGTMRLVPGAVVTHKEAVPVTGSDLRTLWQDFKRGGRFPGLWKGVYGLRNVVHSGRTHGFVSGGAALSYVALQAARVALFDDHKLRTAYLYALYAADGWRGRFRNVPPARWARLAEVRDLKGELSRESMRYDADVSEPVRRLTTRPAPPAASTPAA
jgi:GT2 family glycosyltransferase